MPPRLTILINDRQTEHEKTTVQMPLTVLPNEALQKIAQFFLSRKFTDFEIRVGSQYVFYVHKNLVSAYSNYFESCMGGAWKEAEQGHVSLDESPVTVARMIEWIYFGFVGLDETDQTLTTILTRGRTDNSMMEERPSRIEDLNEKPFVTFAKLYAFADCYYIPTLKTYAEAGFIAEVRGEDFLLTDLLAAIGVVYTLTSDYDDTLRKWLVFTTQSSLRHLRKQKVFTDELADNTVFSIDLITKYAAANWVWCPECKAEIELVECKCAFSGLCGYRLCTEQKWAELGCTACNRRGHLQRHAHAEDLETEDLGRMKVKDVVGGGIKTPSAILANGRKRKNGAC